MMNYRFTTIMALALLVVAALPCSAQPAASACPTDQSTASQLLKDGNASFERGDLARAEALWAEIRQCAHGHPDWPKAVFNLGLLEKQRRNFSQAIAYFDEVLRSHPNDKEPGSSIMETNRNYSHRSAFAISECYEATGAYGSALRYAYLAKTKYRYYSWCGTCLDSANMALNKRIAYLTFRASHVHIWAAMLVVGFVAIRWRKARNGKGMETAG